MVEWLDVFVLEFVGLYLCVEEGVWVLDGISIIVGLRSKCTCFGVVSGCPVRSKVEVSFVQLPQRKEQSRSAPRVKW